MSLYSRIHRFALMAACLSAIWIVFGCQGEQGVVSKRGPAKKGGHVRVVNLTDSVITANINAQTAGMSINPGSSSKFVKFIAQPTKVIIDIQGAGKIEETVDVPAEDTLTLYLLPPVKTPKVVTVVGDPRKSESGGTFARIVNLTSIGDLVVTVLPIGGGQGLEATLASGKGAKAERVEPTSYKVKATANGKVVAEGEAAFAPDMSYTVAFGSPDAKGVVRVTVIETVSGWATGTASPSGM